MAGVGTRRVFEGDRVIVWHLDLEPGEESGRNTLWERTSNVPFIWAGLGIAEGKKSDVTVSLIDIYPTPVELCQLPDPHQKLEGESLAKTLADPTLAEDRTVFLPHMNPGEYAVINRDWRYIRYGEDGEELYDLKADPNEWHNLAADPKYADTKATLRRSAPATFAEPARKLNARKDLVIEGESFHWEKGKGNYKPPPKYLPDTHSPGATGENRTRRTISGSFATISTPTPRRPDTNRFALAPWHDLLRSP